MNVLAAIATTRAALPGAAGPQGTHHYIASVAGLLGVFGYSSYSASKHGLVGFTNSLRFELEPQACGCRWYAPASLSRQWSML